MKNQKTIFLPTLLDEVLRRALRLQSKKLKLKIWNKNSTPHTFTADESIVFESKNNGLLVAGLDYEFIENEEYFFTFDSTGVVYFGKGKYQKDLLFTEFYRVDKRQNERLLLYPHYDAHIIFKLVKTQGDNIISIRNPKKQNTNIFNEFNREYFVKRLGEEIDFDSFSFLEARLIDISENGLAFLSNEKEKAYLEVIKPQEISEAYVVIKNEKFIITDLKFLHFVDYVSNKIENIQLYKVGVSFEGKSEQLAEYIDRSLMDDVIDSDKVESEFEDIF